MEITLISNRLLNKMNQQQGLDSQAKKKLAAASIEVLGDFIYERVVPSAWHLQDIQSIDHQKLVFLWTAVTEQAICPECKTLSHNRTKTYLKRDIQDLPISGMTVFHEVKANRYFCDNLACQSITFIEQFDEIADKDARLSHRLKEFALRTALESSCNGASKTLYSLGAKVSGDTIERELKKKGAIIVTQNLQRDDVNVLALDDINLRKGNSSTACTVFIDGETHRVLVIVQGATAEIAEKIIQQYPTVDIVSRDRGTAYSAASNNCNKKQVADGFHLVQNIHKTVKDALSLEMAHDLFVREGDGWIRMVDSPCEETDPDTDCNDALKGLAVIKPETISADDLARRILLAGLTPKQAEKYRKTLAVLEWTESGLRTTDIAKKLSMKKKDVQSYRLKAPEIIETVEQKIDEYYQTLQDAVPHTTDGQTAYRQKTIATKARPALESIVEPYKEVVLSMVKEGKTHRDIHPVLVKAGFKGSKNAIYQYIIKYAYENGIPNGRYPGKRPVSERITQAAEHRPLRISVERVSRTTLYENILHMAAVRRDKIKQSLLGLETATNSTSNGLVQSDSDEWINKTQYADRVAKLVFDTLPKKKNAKKN